MALMMAGCGLYVATPRPVYYESKWLQPLSAGLEPPLPRDIKDPSPEMLERVSGLPPVLLIQGRNIYLFDQVYYYRAGKAFWYFSRSRTGPWYRLPKGLYPLQEEMQPMPGPFIESKPRPLK